MLEPFAGPEDVEDVWGELTLDETKLVVSWLGVASTNLRLLGRKRGFDVDNFIASDELLKTAAKNAVVESVRRRLSNPRALRQRSTSPNAGPFGITESETVDATASSGLLYFTDAELDWLPVKKRGGFRTIHAKSGYYR